MGHHPSGVAPSGNPENMDPGGIIIDIRIHKYTNYSWAHMSVSPCVLRPSVASHREVVLHCLYHAIPPLIVSPHQLLNGRKGFAQEPASLHSVTENFRGEDWASDDGTWSLPLLSHPSRFSLIFWDWLDGDTTTTIIIAFLILCVRRYFRAHWDLAVVIRSSWSISYHPEEYLFLTWAQVATIIVNL